MTDLAPDPMKVGDFIRRYIPNEPARLVLLIMFSLMLLAGLASYFGNAERAIETICVLFIFFYLALLAIAASMAIVPIGDLEAGGHPASVKNAQRNARGSLVLVIGLGVLIMAVVDFMVFPIWTNLMFEMQYQRLKFGNIEVTRFLSSVNSSDSAAVQDLNVSQLGISEDRIRDTHTVFRLFGRDTAISKVDIRDFKGDAVIAAPEVTFQNSSSIRIGNKNLFVLANILQLDNGKSGSQIYAYSADDVPSDAGLDPTLAGRSGAPAGNVTIVVLGEIRGQGSLTIDLRGQRGGKGARGQQPAARVGASSPTPLPGRPQWSFRKPKEAELAKFDGYVLEQLANPQIDEKTKQLLRTNQAALNACSGKQSDCKLILCDELHWGEVAEGRPGEEGKPAQDGGTGGTAGEPGVLRIFYLKSQPSLRTTLVAKTLWSDANSVDVEPPLQLSSEGGDPSEPGLGGAGGQGAPGDPFGVCGSGAAGKPGPPGMLGKKGNSGPTSHRGASASFTALSLF